MNDIEKLRKAKGWSMAELAQRCNPKTQSSQISKLEKGQIGLSQTWMQRLAKALNVSITDLLPESDFGFAAPASSLLARPRSANRSSSSPDTTHRHDYMMIEELDVAAQGGFGAVVDVETVLGQWSIPARAIRQRTNSPADMIKAISVKGDSMAPLFTSGTYIFVDLMDTTPIPPGVFVLEEFGVLIVKRLELVNDEAQDQQNPSILVKSENPAYETIKRHYSDLCVKGRVIGYLGWI